MNVKGIPGGGAVSKGGAGARVIPRLRLGQALVPLVKTRDFGMTPNPHAIKVLFFA